MTYKEIATDFLKLAVAGEARLAFAKYTSPAFRHHNAWFKGDANSLMTAMDEDAKRVPGKIFEIKHILQDGPLVAAHSHLRQTPEDPGMAVIHIFRFESNRIAELWDFGQAIPPDIINENGMF